METLKPTPPTNAVYVIGVAIVGLFLFAFFWIVLYAGITQVGAAVTTMMQRYSGNTTYTAFEYASSFIVNLWKYLLGVAVLGLLLWALIYSQRKGQVMIK